MASILKILSILSLPLTIYSFVHNSRSFLVRESTTTIVNEKNSNILHQYDFFPTSSRNTSNKSVQLLSSTSPPDIPAPTFDGKMVFPMRAILGGLQPHKVCATFAIMDSGYKRGDNSWGQCSFVGTTYDLYSTLMELKEEHGAEKVSHVRVISFQIPNKEAMEKQASEWFGLSEKATEGSTLFYSPVIENENEFKNEEERESISLEEQKEKLARALDATAYLFEEGDDYDYDDDGDNLESPEADTIVSPFEEEKNESSDSSLDAKKELEFNVENVDKVLDEVRPYLISDGGNVSVHSVDESTGNVYLVLEGACGSCPSSTVTMQMGIERVLKEKFSVINEVLQVEENGVEDATELTMDVVQAEVNRLAPAISAMGGQIEIVSVDASTGNVEIRFKGSSKIQKGLELALLDVQYVESVRFLD